MRSRSPTTTPIRGLTLLQRAIASLETDGDIEGAADQVLQFESLNTRRRADYSAEIRGLVLGAYLHLGRGDAKGTLRVLRRMEARIKGLVVRDQ